MRSNPLRLLVPALLLLLPSCLWLDGDSRVFVYSDPPGADVFVDGEDTGLTTPAELPLGALFGSDHRITVRKKGFEAEHRTVSHYSQFNTSHIDEGHGDLTTPPFPFWWTTGDVVFPLEMRWSYVPHNLFVKLFPVGTFEKKPEAESK